MADTTPIEWTDATWNPITGCTLVSEGCKHCYAATLAAGRMQHHWSRTGLARRNAGGEAKFTGEVRFNEQWLDQPLRWNRSRLIFVCAHSDLFHEAVPDEWIDRVFHVMALAPQHTFQVLTKRPERAQVYLTNSATQQLYPGLPLPNVWLGTSVEDQATAAARVPPLLATPAAVRFVSYEPALGPVNFRRLRLAPDYHMMLDALEGYGLSSGGRTRIDWVIVGGESGRGARPMHPDWARKVRDDCEAAGVAFLFKQWGAWIDEQVATAAHMAPGPDMFDRFGQPKGPNWHPYDAGGRNGGMMIRVGKKAAGRLLDGREHNGMPGAHLPLDFSRISPAENSA